MGEARKETVEATKAPVADVNAKSVKAEKVAKTPKVAKVKEPKLPGVIATIQNTIAAAKTPITQDQILDALVLAFPGKPKAGMLKTVKAQTGGKAQPTRMEKERGIKFVITANEETKVKAFMLAK